MKLYALQRSLTRTPANEPRSSFAAAVLRFACTRNTVTSGVTAAQSHAFFGFSPAPGASR